MHDLLMRKSTRLFSLPLYQKLLVISDYINQCMEKIIEIDEQLAGN